MSYHGGTSEMAAIDDGVLVVDIPGAESGRVGSYVGLVSMGQPAFWLSGLEEGGAMELTFDFVAERTNGFDIMVQSGTTYSPGAYPPSPRLVFSWRQVAGDETDAGTVPVFHFYDAVDPWPDDAIGEPMAAPEALPESITLRLAAGRAVVSGDGIGPFSLDVPWLADDLPVYMHVLSHGPAAGEMPSRPALRRIELRRETPEAPTEHPLLTRFRDLEARCLPVPHNYEELFNGHVFSQIIRDSLLHRVNASFDEAGTICDQASLLIRFLPVNRHGKLRECVAAPNTSPSSALTTTVTMQTASTFCRFLLSSASIFCST